MEDRWMEKIMALLASAKERGQELASFSFAITAIQNMMLLL